MNIKYPLLIDGGLSNELENLGCDLNHKLWSAKMLTENPEALVEAHLAYLLAGAKCITTASYQATIQGFSEMGFDKKASVNLLKKSVELAERATDKFMGIAENNSKPLIAASIGPYGAYLADGSEYRGNYNISKDELHNFHRERISILDETNADIFAVETIPDFEEAYVLAELFMNTKKTAWFSFSCKDNRHINDGTGIGTCTELLCHHPNVFAIGINCTAPENITSLIQQVKPKAENKKVIAYPNSGEAYNAKSKQWMGLSKPLMFAQMAEEWINTGADIIGGCCRIGPEHIKSISDLIRLKEQSM